MVPYQQIDIFDPLQAFPEMFGTVDTEIIEQVLMTERGKRAAVDVDVLYLCPKALKANLHRVILIEERPVHLEMNTLLRMV
jgi:hypothetical protein